MVREIATCSIRSYRHRISSIENRAICPSVSQSNQSDWQADLSMVIRSDETYVWSRVRRTGEPYGPVFRTKSPSCEIVVISVLWVLYLFLRFLATGLQESLNVYPTGSVRWTFGYRADTVRTWEHPPIGYTGLYGAVRDPNGTVWPKRLADPKGTHTDTRMDPARLSTGLLGAKHRRKPCLKVMHAQLSATGYTASVWIPKSSKNRADPQDKPFYYTRGTRLMPVGFM